MIKMWSLLAKLFMKCSLEEDGQGSPGVVRAPARSCCSCSSSCSICSCCSAWVACSSSCRGACSVLRQLRRHGQQRGQTPSLTRSPLTSTDHALAVVSLQMEMVTYLYSNCRGYYCASVLREMHSFICLLTHLQCLRGVGSDAGSLLDVRRLHALSA